MKIRRIKYSIILIISNCIMLSCTIFIGGPSYPEYPIPISTEAVGELQSSISDAIILGASTGTVIITITEAQLTSYIAMKINQNPDPVLYNPQIYLYDGQIQFFGTAIQGYFQATVALVLTIGVDETGILAIKLTSADFGPLPAPEGFTSTITALLEEAFTGSIGPMASGIRLTDAAVGNGEITIRGQVK